MADFVNPGASIPPDVLGSYLRGQMSAYQTAGAQQQVQAGQQDLTKGALSIQQLQLALQNSQALSGYARSRLQQQQSGAPPGGAPAGPNVGGGIQNGPQSAVSAPGGYSSGPGFDPQTQSAIAMLTGQDPVKAATEAQQYNVAQAQLQAKGPLDALDTMISNPKPALTVMSNPSYMSGWPKAAAALGMDPVKDFSDDNVRRALIWGANKLRASVGMDAKDYPVALQNVDLGQGEVGQINPVTHKKEGDLVERQTPGYTLVDKFDPATNTTTKVPVQTSGYGMGGTNPYSGGTTTTGGAPGGTAPPAGFNAGMAKPTDPELKAAMFGSEMRAGMNTLSSMESQGFNLSPSTRALLIHAATSEDSGAISQLVGQEALAHGVNQKEQTYISALMPVLQAAGHDQSGARLTTGQIRQNVESLLPINTANKSAMEQVQKNRQGFYTGLLTQAGSAAQLPQYKNTLGADLKNLQGSAQNVTKTIGGKTYVQQNGKWYQQ